jgi:hypothetical protein
MDAPAIIHREQAPPDAVTSSQAYRPDPIMAATSLNYVRTLDVMRPGDMLQTPDETRAVVPVRRDQLPAVIAQNRMVAETVQQVQGDVTRAINTSTGFTPYVLETPAKVIFPVQAPMVQLTPRMVGKGTDIEHWKSVISIFNQSGPFGQTHWGGTTDGGTTIDSPTYVLNSYQSSYQTISQYNSVTFQSQWRSRALEGDMLARRKAELVYALKLQEENWIINGAVKLWRPAKPLLTGATTGGNLAGSTTYWVQVSAVNGNGESLPSTAASITLGSTSTGSITINFSGVIGATSYNVYIGTGSTQPANSSMFICVNADFSPSGLPQQPADYIGSMAISALLVTAPTTGNHPLTTGTATVNTNLFDGMISLCYLNPNTGGNLSVGEQGMTSVIVQPSQSSGLLVLQDIQFLFRKMYSQAMAEPEYLFVSPVEAVTIDNLVGTASNFRILAEPQSAGNIGGLTAGQKVTHILNQVTGTTVQVKTLPYLPQGTIVAGSFSIPYPAPDVQDPPFRLMVNQDYTSVDYPPTQASPQTWGFGMFVDETLVNQFQGGFGLIEGIQPAAGI